jgi:hypothetical protein
MAPELVVASLIWRMLLPVVCWFKREDSITPQENPGYGEI